MWASAAGDVGTGSDTALIVSIIALVISASVAAWNVLKYALDGGRVKVRLLRGYIDEPGALYSHPFHAPLHGLLGQIPDIHFEVAIIQVENSGRTAVTVHEPSFDLGGRWNWKRLRYGRWTVAPRLVPFGDATTKVPVRIEPFDFVTFLLDVEPALQAQRPFPEKDITYLRASVRVAGKRLRRRSSRRSAWKVRTESRSLSEPFTVELSAFRGLVRLTQLFEEGAPLYGSGYAAREIQAAWDRHEPLTLEVMKALLERTQRAGATGSTTSTAFTIRDRLISQGFIDTEGRPVTKGTT